MEEDFPHQDEKRDRRQGEIHHRQNAVANNLRQPGVASEIQHRPDDIDRDEGKRYWHSHEQQQRGAAQQQECGQLPAHDADTASVRGDRSALLSRCMRKTNSIATSRNATGSTAKSHHSGVTRVFIVTAPAW